MCEKGGERMADLPYLEAVDVRDTRMSCCGTLEVCGVYRGRGRFC
jgi:hypothetical protein